MLQNQLGKQVIFCKQDPYFVQRNNHNNHVENKINVNNFFILCEQVIIL